jgi:hypothetical protein
MVDTGLGVIRHPLLEEVSLALKRNHVHEVKGVGDIVVLLVAESDEKTVSNELDVLAHQCRVHANEGDRESIYKRTRKPRDMKERLSERLSTNR